MGYMFNGCHSLSYLPDISKWNKKNVYYMEYMFAGCHSLSYLPDISKWNEDALYVKKENMFNGCFSLS